MASSLRARITLVVLLILLLLVAVLILSSLWSEKRSQARFEASATHAQQQLWQKINENFQDQLQASTRGITRDRNIKNALAKEDKASLAEALKTSYNLLSGQELISQLRVTSKAGTELVQLPSDKQVKNAALISEVLKTGKVARGFEQNSQGELLTSIAFPFTKRGKVIGVGVLSQNLQQAIAAYTRSSNRDAMLLNPQGGTIAAATRPEGAGITELQPNLMFGYQVMQQGEAYLEIVATPIVQRETLAYLISGRDITSTYLADQRFSYISYAIVFVMTLGAALLILWYMKRSLQPLAAAIDQLKAVASGDLTQTVVVNRQDEIGLLQASVKEMVLQLRELMSKLKSTSTVLADSSRSMGSDMEETESSINHLTDNIGQVASAMNEMTTTVQKVALNAQEASIQTEEANRNARQSTRLLQETRSVVELLSSEFERATEAINKVEHDSREIGEVLAVIQGIAEQTNLLALNAAIEAARAGDQGRGFAVVADEVRSLATRSQQATEEIQQTIERLQNGSRAAADVMQRSHQKVDQGVSVFVEAEQALQTITAAIDQINDMSTQIATATEQQQLVADEITQNVDSINGIAQQANGLASNTVTAAAEIGNHAVVLDNQMKTFQV